MYHSPHSLAASTIFLLFINRLQTRMPHPVYFRRADFRLIVFDDGAGIKKVNCHLEAVAFRNDSLGKRVRNFGENAAHLL